MSGFGQTVYVHLSFRNGLSNPQPLRGFQYGLKEPVPPDPRPGADPARGVFPKDLGGSRTPAWMSSKVVQSLLLSLQDTLLYPLMRIRLNPIFYGELIRWTRVS